MPNKKNIDTGFSKIAKYYEALEKSSGLINYMRKRVRNHLEKHLDKNSEILEINCGSGIDAVYLAKKGHKVLATDIAGGMINFVKQKIKKQNLQRNLSCQILSFTEIDTLKPQKFNHIFSNFGGLNCSSIAELQQLFKNMHDLLLPCGKITLVIMPKICLWEFGKIIKGNTTAFRRLKQNGVLANIEGEKVRTYYYGANQIKKELTPYFKNFEVENICFLGPTGNRVDFVEKHPKLFRVFSKLDTISNKIPFLQGYGDYYLITATKR